jgi:hypothetical protein
MRGCSRRHKKHHGGDSGLNLGYTGPGQATTTIPNPFLGYVGKPMPKMEGGTCGTNASLPSNASDFLSYSRQGGTGYVAKGGSGSGNSFLRNPEILSNTGNLGTQTFDWNGSIPTAATTAATSAPHVTTKGGSGGFPKPPEGANINLSNSGSVFSGSNPYLITRGGGYEVSVHPEITGGSASILSAPEIISNAPNVGTQNFDWNGSVSASGTRGGGSHTATSILSAPEIISNAPNVGTQNFDWNGSTAASTSASVSGTTTATKGGAPDISKAYPVSNTGPAHVNWINNQPKHGGGCGCGAPLTLGGGGRRKHNHRRSRKYGRKSRRHRRTPHKRRTHKRRHMRGGRNFGDLVPNGLLGQPWTSNVATWPGVDGVPMNRGHYELNNYANDVSRQTQNIGANFPFNGLPWKGGSTRRHRRHRRHRGGTMSNFLSQDIINLGREFGFNTSSAYNALNGVSAPTNPLPWKDQMTSLRASK